MTKKDNDKLVKVLTELVTAADMCMGEATSGKPVQDWGLVNRAMVNAGKAQAFLKRGGKLELMGDK